MLKVKGISLLFFIDCILRKVCTALFIFLQLLFEKLQFKFDIKIIFFKLLDIEFPTG